MDDSSKVSLSSNDQLPQRVEVTLARTAEYSVPKDPGQYGGVRGPELEAAIAELSALADELRHPTGRERCLAMVEARLGALTAIRFVLDGRPEDRVRARELLEAARVSGALGEDARRRAHRDLLALLVSRLVRLLAEVPEPRQARPNGLRFDDLRKAVEVGRLADQGGTGIPEDSYRLCQLLLEDESLGLTAEDREKIKIFVAAMEAMRQGDLRGVITAGERALAADNGTGFLLPQVVNSLAPAALSLIQGSAAGTGRAEQAEPSVETPTDPLRDLWEIAALAEARDPGTLDPGEVPKLIAKLSSAQESGQHGPPLSSRMIAVMSHYGQAMRTGDMTGLSAALKLMHEAFAANEFDAQQFSGWLLPVAAGVLTGASMMGGSLEDQELAGAIYRDLDRYVPEDGIEDTPEASMLRLCGHCVRLRFDLDAALADGDVDGIESVITRLQDLEDDAGEAEEWVGVMFSFLFGAAYLSLAHLTRTVEDVRMATHHFEQILERTVDIPAIRSLIDASWAPLLALIAMVEKDPGRLVEGIERSRSVLARPGMTFDFSSRVRMGLAIGLQSLHKLTGDAAHLDEALRELEQARAELPPGAPGNSSVHGMYAEMRAQRAATRHDTPTASDASDEAATHLRAAVAAARDALRASADNVLLQSEARHALQVAREAADRGREAALWALRAGDPEEAVGCLEAGRSLVLQAAAESSGVADRLEALGARELAGRWRTAASARGSSYAAQDSRSALEGLLSGSPEAGPELPSEVRRESLALLRDRERPVDVPASEAVAALRTGLARSGADALVHLLPGSGTEDGALLIVTPEGPVRAITLPELSQGGRSPVTDFLGVGAHRQKLAATDCEVSHQEWDRTDRAWTSALTTLCDWAGGVLGPLLDELGLWERALRESGLVRTQEAESTDSAAVRLVLVPCGELGVVPWQAAVLRPPATHGGPATVCACEVAVVSHAASGREFLRAAVRERMRPAERPALVYHGYDLEWAEDEVRKLADTFYPDVVPYSEDHGTPPTPQTVLALLRGGGEASATLVHLACHGLAGLDPTTSALHLAPSPDASADDATAGNLTLSTLLDAPSEGVAFRSRGPLVVYSACETDLTTRDHDEALTVTSVLVHRLATDAVGSRWQVLDGASEILMLVFHDRIAAGLAPPDALRAAQRWMLTRPDLRPRVPALDGISEYRLREVFRGRPEAWAAFVHQGNPAPATAYERGQGGSA